MAKLALVAAALTLAFAGTASAVTYEPEPAAFCQPTTVRDFLKPLDRLPDLKQPRADGRLQFTKALATLKPTEQLVVGGGPIGFKLQRLRGPAIHPNWTLAYNLSRVNWRGKGVSSIARGKRTIGTLGQGKGVNLSFEVGAKPAPYRLSVRFRARDGRLLAAYGFYFLVVKPFKDLRLALNASSYRPGQTVFGRVENLGTIGTGYGVAYKIERQEGSQWVEAPESPRGPWIMIAELTPPGRTGRCFPFGIEPTMPPGRYRMSKDVGSVTDASQATILTAEFDVLP